MDDAFVWARAREEAYTNEGEFLLLCCTDERGLKFGLRDMLLHCLLIEVYVSWTEVNDDL